MTVVEFVLILASVLLIGGFVALLFALVRVSASLRLLRTEMQSWRRDISPLVESLRESTDDARLVMDEVRQDLGRFDKVLGSAEAISGAVEGSARVTRVALSTPMIKIAAFASGTSRAARRIRRDRDDVERVKKNKVRRR